jgi:hypothetical protein
MAAFYCFDRDIGGEGKLHARQVEFIVTYQTVAYASKSRLAEIGQDVCIWNV